MSRFDFPETGMGSCISIKPVLHRGNKIRYKIEGYRFWIQFNLSTNKAILAYTEGGGGFRENFKVNLSDELDDLPEDLRDFILFNLDIFA
jgi:hypothetical protein